ncbi:MAG: hypothetical protein AAGK02_10365, partial [Pseudomonadota bacterium]
DTIDNQVNGVIAQCRSVVVCVGRHGFGDYQRDTELPLIKTLSEVTIIPIAAPGATQEMVAELQSHLPETTLYVDLSGQPPQYIPLHLHNQIVRGLGSPLRPRGNANDFNMSTDRIASSAKELANLVASDGLVVFLGGTWRRSTEEEVQPDTEEMAQYLLGQMATSEAGMTLPDYVRPSLDEAARIFELRRGFDALQKTAVGGFVNARTARPSTRFGKIAGMLRELTRNVQPVTTLSDKPPDRLLVFTTNIDLRLERNLIDSGTPFVRVVVMKGGEGVRAAAFKDVRGLAEGGFSVSGEGGTAEFSLTSVRDGPDNPKAIQSWQRIRDFLRDQDVPDACHPKPEDVQEVMQLGEVLDEDRFAIDLADLDNLDKLRRLPQLVIVKLLGSSGIPDSVALTSGQLLNLGDFASIMPKSFKERLEHAPKVFFGFSAGESLFQKVYSTFLRNTDCTRPKSYAVFESFAEHDDIRGILERIVGSSRIDDALQSQLGLQALITRSSDFADTFIAELGVARARTHDDGGTWL